ncbi:hypothetical protein [Vibrio cholerae]|uniref:hypothetical protein n=1 Tax=Vibrio cholerae TaxID=666 RepID=UPI000AEBC873|nr:hypothetical protein [Vibrio cholerae]
MTNLISTIDSELFCEHQSVIEKFNVIVREFRQLIELDNNVLYIPLSFGKDSKIICLAALEAYRQSLAESKIAKNHPLLMATVNTQAESLPMVMYPRYCVPRLNKYAKEIGINLIHSMITPSFYDEYANRYLGAQKLIPNATRSGDCSVILKVDPAKEFIKSVRSRLLNSESLKPYHDSTVICVTGQRSSESARRMNNMNSQGVSAKDLNRLKAELTELSISGLNKTLNFAPIRDWTTDEVFLAHELAGIKPLTRNLLGIYNAIPSFLPDHALMLSIYGNASTEQCEISIGSTANNGCNGKARYGCGICTMIGEKDKTQSSLTLHERWNYLGQKELLSIRDFMYRLSIDISQRAFHAKAIDQVAYNRIALQANILKPEALETLVRLFSQISILSAERAEEFRNFVETGNAEQHPAIKEIKSDLSLNAKARRAFVEMYIEEAQKPLIQLFSEKHAIYLSFRWALDGIQAYPFTPLAIWNECITNKKNWIKWPSLNSEIDTPKKSLNDPTNKLPDAVMMPVLQSKFENPSVYIENDELHDIGNFVSSSISSLPLAESEFDCTTQTTPHWSVDISIECSLQIELGEPHDLSKSVSIQLDSGRFATSYLHVSKFDLIKITVDKRSTGEAFKKLILDSEVERIIDKYVENFIESIELSVNKLELTAQECSSYLKRVINDFNGNHKIKLSIPFWKNSPFALTMHSKFKTEQRILSSHNFTKRRVKVLKNGRMEKSTTRLNFYPLRTQSKFYLENTQSVNLFNLDFSTKRVPFRSYVDSSLCDSIELDTKNIFLSDIAITRWKAVGGYNDALDEYYNQKSLNYNVRTSSGSQFMSIDAASHLIRMGVIEIHKGYIRTFEKLMQRTALFTEIGAFNYQSMSYEDLIKMPWAVAMKQHRSDKAEVLLELRRKFHKQNEEIRTQLSLSNLSAYSAQKAIDQHISNARYAVVTYIDSTLSKAFKSQFTTSNVSLSQKSKSSLLWIVYHQALMNVDEFITYVTPFRSTIKDDSESYLVLGQHIKNSICALRTQINDAWSRWVKLIDRFEILNLEVNQTLVDSQTAGTETSNRIKEEILARYKQAIKDLHPNISNELFEADASFWKPNTKSLIHEFELMAQSINYCRTIVNNYLDTLILVEASAGYSQFKKIELNKQLELSQSIPVIVDSIIKPSSHCLIEVERTLPVDKHNAKPKRPKKDGRKVDHFSLLMGI